jgi:hypothetical protein
MCVKESSRNVARGREMVVGQLPERSGDLGGRDALGPSGMGASVHGGVGPASAAALGPLGGRLTAKPVEPLRDDAGAWPEDGCCCCCWCGRFGRTTEKLLGAADSVGSGGASAATGDACSETRRLLSVLGRPPRLPNGQREDDCAGTESPAAGDRTESSSEPETSFLLALRRNHDRR